MLESAFLLLGLTIVAGFFSLMFFERTKIPDVLLLMLLGVLVGPILGWVDTGLLTGFAPFLGGIALIIILFDGGMNLNIVRVLGELAPASAFTFAAFFLTAGFTALVTHYAFGWDWLWGLLLGVVLGGSSSNIVIPIVSRMSVSEDAKMLLNLESALTDALCIVFAISLVAIMGTSAVDASTVVNSLLGSFSIAAVAGLIAGILWLRVLKELQGKPFAYMLTLAALFILYAVIEGVKANGAIGILVFGLILGNSKFIAQAMKSREEAGLDGVLRGFQTEVSFFVRTFFFVYLGVVFNIKALTPEVFLASFAVLVALVAARFLTTELFVRLQRGFSRYKLLLNTMAPRGLAAAVLAGIPAANGIRIPNFAEIVFIIILLTNVVATVGALAYTGNGASAPSKPRIVARR